MFCDAKTPEVALSLTSSCRVSPFLDFVYAAGVNELPEQSHPHQLPYLLFAVPNSLQDKC